MIQPVPSYDALTNLNCKLNTSLTSSLKPKIILPKLPNSWWNAIVFLCILFCYLAFQWYMKNLIECNGPLLICKSLKFNLPCLQSSATWAFLVQSINVVSFLSFFCWLNFLYLPILKGKIKCLSLFIWTHTLYKYK